MRTLRILLAGVSLALLPSGLLAWSWKPLPDDQLKDRLVSYARQSGHAAFADRIAAETDPASWIGETVAYAEEGLRACPVSDGRDQRRYSLLRLIDYPVHVDMASTNTSQAVREAWFRTMCDQNARARARVFEAVKRTPVAEGELGVFHFYNMGYVLKGPRHVVALDVTDSPCPWADSEREELAKVADCFVLTHPHRDHYSPQMLKAFLDKGKPVVLPCDVGVKGDLVRIFAENHDRPADVVGVGVRNYMGHQRVPCNVYQLDIDGVRVVSTGDNDAHAVFTNLVRGAATDVIITPVWNFPSNIVRACMSNPGFDRKTALFLPSHFNELGHGVRNRESYWEAYARKDRLSAPGVVWPNTLILYLGESVLWKRKMAVAAETPAAQCLARMRELASSDACAWAWTYPWFDHNAKEGDRRNAVLGADGVWRPKTLAETVLVSPGGRAEKKVEEQFGLRPKFYYLDFYHVTGTYRQQSYYAANRASMTAIVRKAWKEYGSVPVFTWHMEHPCVTNGFPKAPYRFKCSEHRDVAAAIVRPTPKSGQTVFRTWFEDRLAEIAGFLNGLTDEKGAKIPVVLRYAHEMDGSWFWWGKGHCSARDFIALARMEADFLRSRCGDGQILFAYTPDRHWKGIGKEGESGYLKWYPGDAFVDVIGYDDYAFGKGKTPKDRATGFANTLGKLRCLSDYAAAHGKVAVLSESGAPDSGFFYEDMAKLASSEGVRIAFFNTWIGPWTWPKTGEGMADLRRFAATRTIEKKR